MRSHALEKKLATLFTCSSAAARFEAQNMSFQAPKRQTSSHFGLLSGRSTIWQWNRLHRRLHAPAMLCQLLPRTSTCLRVRDTRQCMAGTRLLPPVSPRFRHVSMPHHHATWQEKKKIGKMERGFLRSKLILKTFMASSRS